MLRAAHQCFERQSARRCAATLLAVRDTARARLQFARAAAIVSRMEIAQHRHPSIHLQRVQRPPRTEAKTV